MIYRSIEIPDHILKALCSAPGSNIDMLGTGEVDAFHTQVIGWNVEVGGDRDTFVLYNGDEQYSEPSAIE